MIPLTIDEVIKSNIKDVKFFGVNLLFEIVKSSTQEKMYQSLKINNKYERQLAFNYNSEKQMKEILNIYLDRIVLEVICNLSQMNEAVEAINRIEQYAIDKNIYSNTAMGAANQITENQLNELRVKYTRDSEWGEILQICRRQMEQETFDKILPELLMLMVKGHDLVTKSAAVTFVSDIVLENRTEIIAPKNSRKIAQKLIEIYSQNSVTSCLQLKQSMVILYASCLGLQFKILKAFPETSQNLVKSIMELPVELEFIKTINLYEIMKNIPNEMIRTGGPNGVMMFKAAVPMLYINRYKTHDHQLKTLSERVLKYLTNELIEANEEHREEKGYLANLEVENSEEIFSRIHTLFDSNYFEERISAGLAIEDLSVKMQSFELAASLMVKQNIEKMMELIRGKYFNKKELLVTSFAKLMHYMEEHAVWVSNPDFTREYLDLSLKQISKFSKSNMSYKNVLIDSLN